MAKWTLQLETQSETEPMLYTWLEDGQLHSGPPQAQQGEWMDIEFAAPSAWDSVFLNLSWSALAPDPNPNPAIVAWEGDHPALNQAGQLIKWQTVLIDETELYRFRATVVFKLGTTTTRYHVDPEMIVGPGQGGGSPPVGGGS